MCPNRRSDPNLEDKGTPGGLEGMSSNESRQAALDALRAAALEAREAGELAPFFGSVEALRVELLLAAASPAHLETGEGDRLLTAQQASLKIGMSIWWIRANKDALPIVRLPSGRYAFSEKALNRWIQRRTS